MAIVDLTAAKMHLRVDGSDDDQLIQSLLKAAIGSTSNYLNRSIPWKDEAGSDVEVPEEVNAAIITELRALYDGSDDVQSVTFKRLLAAHRVY